MAILGLQACRAHSGAKVIQAQLVPLVKTVQKVSSEQREKMEHLVSLARLVQRVMLDVEETQDPKAQKEQMAIKVQRDQLES
jgi:hypothetical protein